MDQNDFALRSRLSDRQLEILALVSKGLTSKEIGRSLSISPSTVDNHIQAAISRLGARNRMAAVRLLSERASNDGHNGATAAEAVNDQGFRPLSLPPLGGRENQLSRERRLLHIAQICALALVALSAAILTIAGAVHIISP